jgi:uncharacterized protein (UPF0147 family)
MIRNRVSNVGRVFQAAILGGILLSGSVAGWAQQPGGGYRVVDVPAALLDETPAGKKLKMDLDRMILEVLRSETWPLDDAATKSRFDNWFTVFYFGSLTRPDQLTGWVERRQDFLDRRLVQIRTQRMRDYVIRLTAQTMTSIVRENYHPAARYNAMLLIGMLNSSEAVTVGDAKGPPVPLIFALKFMLDELNNPQQLDAVRVAALIGIQRHVRIDRDLPDANRRLVRNNAETMIVDAMANLLNAKEPPEGRTAAGHAWMQRQAAEVLGLLGSVGQGNRVVTTLEQVIEDDARPIALRCAAADALGQLSFPADANLDAVAMAKKLGVVAVLACYEEIKRVEDVLAREKAAKPPVPGYGTPYDPYGGGMGMFGPTTGAIKPKGGGPLGYRIDLTRRRVKDQMLQLKRGLTGHEKQAVKGLSGLTEVGNGAEELSKFVKGLDDIIAVTDNSTFDDITALVAEIRAKVQKMEDDCEIVVKLPGEAELPEGPDGLIDPLGGGLPDLPLGLPGAEAMPELPGEPPAEPPVAAPAPGVPPEPGPPAEPPAPDPGAPVAPEPPLDPGAPVIPGDLPDVPGIPGEN